MKKIVISSKKLGGGIVFMACVLSVCVISCQKFVQVQNPAGQIVSASVFKDDATAISAMDGLYSQVMFGNYFMLNGGASIYCGLSADEIYNRIPLIADNQEFYTNSIDQSNNTLNADLWSSYRYIYQINAILEGVKSSVSLSPSVGKQLTGEAKFMRALYYFYMVNLFGKVPLVISTDYRTNATLPRANVSDVYSQIVSDLRDAEGLLSVSYPSDYRTRPNRLAASALLARVYLFEKNWTSAIDEATAVISSSMYHLEPDLNDVFLNNSSEVILQFQPNSIFNSTVEGLSFVPTASPYSVTAYPITSYLLSAFEPGDLRFTDWVQSKEVRGVIYYYPYKYK